MHLATLCSSVSRAAGGVFTLVSGLNRSLAALDVEVSVIGIRDEHTDVDMPDWGGLDVSAFDTRGPLSFSYAPGYGTALVSSDADVGHCHGLWQYPSVCCLGWSRRTRRPYMVSPQGMLDAWALANSAWKKRLAGLVFQDAHLRQATCMHAVSAAEADSIHNYGLDVPVCVLPNAVSLDVTTEGPAPWEAKVEAGKRVLLYLGRLHPKKAALELVEAWAAAGDDVSDWMLVLAGWDQGGYEQVLKDRAGELGVASRIHFPGPLFGDAKGRALRQADAFVLPSLSEGMPIAVLEAWSARLPVIMTSACNLDVGFREGAAIKVDSTAASIATGLRQLGGMTPSDLETMGAHGRALVEQTFNWDSVGREMKAAYEWMIDGGAPPASVSG